MQPPGEREDSLRRLHESNDGRGVVAYCDGRVECGAAESGKRRGETGALQVI